jgi:hypothetical protein
MGLPPLEAPKMFFSGALGDRIGDGGEGLHLKAAAKVLADVCWRGAEGGTAWALMGEKDPNQVPAGF